MKNYIENIVTAVFDYLESKKYGLEIAMFVLYLFGNQALLIGFWEQKKFFEWLVLVMTITSAVLFVNLMKRFKLLARNAHSVLMYQHGVAKELHALYDERDDKKNELIARLRELVDVQEKLIGKYATTMRLHEELHDRVDAALQAVKEKQE